MTGRCRTCGYPLRCSRFAWFGYWRLWCVNGHRELIATPRRAARNWKRLGP